MQQHGQPLKDSLSKTAKVKRALQLLFGTADEISVYRVAGSITVPADELTGKAAEERLRAAKGKARVADEAAWGGDARQQQLAQPPVQQQHSCAQETLRHVAAAVRRAAPPRVCDAVDKAAAPSPATHSRRSSAADLEIAVLSHGSGSSAASGSSLASGSNANSAAGWHGAEGSSLPAPSCGGASGSSDSLGAGGSSGAGGSGGSGSGSGV